MYTLRIASKVYINQEASAVEKMGKVSALLASYIGEDKCKISDMEVDNLYDSAIKIKRTDSDILKEKLTFIMGRLVLQRIYVDDSENCPSLISKINGCLKPLRTILNTEESYVGIVIDILDENSNLMDSKSVNYKMLVKDKEELMTLLAIAIPHLLDCHRHIVHMRSLSRRLPQEDRLAFEKAFFKEMDNREWLY